MHPQLADLHEKLGAALSATTWNLATILALLQQILAIVVPLVSSTPTPAPAPTPLTPKS